MKFFEEYRGCRCSSPIVESKKLLLGYCPRHGGDRIHAYPVPEYGARKEAAEDRANEVDPTPLFTVTN